MKEEDWNYFRLKRDKETGQLSATHDPGELTGKSRWRVYDKIFLLFWTNFLGEIIKNFLMKKRNGQVFYFFCFFFFLMWAILKIFMEFIIIFVDVQLLSGPEAENC